jgi:N-acetylmuramic acid 6-phosphate etherase
VIAALDGMELAGTFGWPESRTLFVLANGNAIKPGLPGAPEDDSARGADEIVRLVLRPEDVVIAVAASGTTPFTLAAARAAREAGALTIGLAGNAEAPLLKIVAIPVLLDSGPEIIAGSTRMDAGTAQKAALNLLSSLVMIRLGCVYDGYMVEVRADNAKLRARAIRMLTEIAGVDEGAAASALDICDGRVKHAALVASGFRPAEAERILAEAKGNLRTALARLRSANGGQGETGVNAGNDKQPRRF